MNDTSLSADDRGERPSLAILQAALEIGREGREWLGDRLVEDRAEQADLQGEVERLERALHGRESAISALSEQAATAGKLNSQLSRQISVLWEERERLLRFLDDASKEREQMAGALDEARQATEAATGAIDQLAQDRDMLAAELLLARENVTTQVAASPTRVIASEGLASDVVELGRAVELIGEAIGEIRRLARETRRSGPAIPPGMASITSGTPGTSGAPQHLEALAALPALQEEVGRMGQHMETLVSGLTDLLDVQRAHPHTLHRNSPRSTPAIPADSAEEWSDQPLEPAPNDGRTRPLLTLQAVERALARALPSVGLPRGVVSPLLSAWLAGAMPMVSGRDALTTMRVCGRVLAADRMVVVPVDAAFHYPDQLFMHPGSAGGTLTTTGSELLELLLNAVTGAGQERLSLVVFEGANRASVERVLLPLLQLIAQRDEAAENCTLDQVLPVGLPEDGPYASLAGIPWPSNVLVAATITDDEATQPLPSALWARAAYLCLDHVPAASVAVRAADTDAASQQALGQRVSFVPSELWDGWTAETRDEAEMTACVSGDIEILDSRRDVVATWRMIEAALAVIGRCHPTERTSSVLLHHAVVPWAVSAGLAREAARLVQSQSPDLAELAGLEAEPAPKPCCSCLERAIRGAT